MSKIYGTCEKCQTRWSELFLYDDRWLCKTNVCYQEEQAKDDGKIDRDLDMLDEYEQLVNGTKNIPPSVYPD